MTASPVQLPTDDRIARVDTVFSPDAVIHCARPHCTDHRPTPTANPFASWSTQELIDYLVDVGGRPVLAYIEYGRRRERGDITGDGDSDADGGDE
jgi:hypothetical protein